MIAAYPAGCPPRWDDFLRANLRLRLCVDSSWWQGRPNGNHNDDGRRHPLILGPTALTLTPTDFRFPVECPACKAVYSLTGEAIGRNGKCRCGNRFLVTGPHALTLLATRAFLCICPHCHTRVVASHDAPAATRLCCHCGKIFQTDSSVAMRLSEPSSPPAAGSSRPPQQATGSQAAASAEAVVRAIIDEWPEPNRKCPDTEEHSISHTCTSSLPPVGPTATPSEPVVTASGVGLWTVFQCPRCSCNTAFIATGTDTRVQCALCSSYVILQRGAPEDRRGSLGDPTNWMQCFCPRCNLRIAVDHSYRDKMILCPKCSNAFKAPLGGFATSQLAAPTYSRPLAAFSHRPLPVRSYYKKNGTRVDGYRRSRPRKRL